MQCGDNEMLGARVRSPEFPACAVWVSHHLVCIAAHRNSTNLVL